MPVQENYIYADIPHEKTVIQPDIYRNGCHSEVLGSDAPRGRTLEYPVQNGWTEDGRRIMKTNRVEHIEKSCGHEMRETDDACTGCVNRAPARRI